MKSPGAGKQSTLPEENCSCSCHMPWQTVLGDSAALKIYLITNEHVDSCWPLLVDLADLARGNAEKLSNFFCQFSSCQFFKIDGMVHCKRERARPVSTKFLCSQRSGHSECPAVCRTQRHTAWVQIMPQRYDLRQLLNILKPHFPHLNVSNNNKIYCKEQILVVQVKACRCAESSACYVLGTYEH